MYAYVDETGNTDNRIFDPNQPLFITAALMTRGNFDILRKPDFARVDKAAGETLHAKELEPVGVEKIAQSLMSILKPAKPRFFFSRVEKQYLAATKVFDTYFDSGENRAMPWQAYNIRVLRLTLTFKLAYGILTEEICRTVWDALTVTGGERARALFVEAAQAMLSRINLVPDARSRQIFTEALHWATQNPDEFGFSRISKFARLSYSPNFVAFTNLIVGLDRASEAIKSPVREIVHHRQSEFERTFTEWHELTSNARDGSYRWPGEEEEIRMRRVPGSHLRMASAEGSPGLQVVDVVLWLFSRMLASKPVGPHSGRLLNFVFQHGYQNDFSFAGVEASVKRKLDDAFSREISTEDMQRGQEILAMSEQRRIEAMEQHLMEKRQQLPG